MNFQAVSIGQKLIEKNVGSGGYEDAIGTPSSALLEECRELASEAETTKNSR
jgi:hypothetical protein